MSSLLDFLSKFLFSCQLGIQSSLRKPPLSIRNFEAHYPHRAHPQAIPLSLSKRSGSQHSDPNPAVLSICHKVAANASIGPELNRVPHQSQDPRLPPPGSPLIPPPPPQAGINPKGLRK